MMWSDLTMNQSIGYIENNLASKKNYEQAAKMA